MPSKTFFMDFFMRNFKKITIGWMLLLFVFWLVPRVCSFGDSLLVDYALVTIFYIALFVIAIISFSIIVLIEVISTKKYKWLGKLFVVLVVPVMLLAVTGLYRFWMDCWGDPMCFLDAQEAKQNGVFYAEYNVSPSVVCINDTVDIHFGDAVGQYYREKDKSRFFDFPRYNKSDRRCIMLNCSVNNASLIYTDLFWHVNNEIYVNGPMSYGKGKQFVKIPLERISSSDTIYIGLRKCNTSEIIDTICLVKQI